MNKRSTRTINQEKERLGRWFVMKDGTKAQLVKYNDSRDVTLRWPDGTVLSGITYADASFGRVTRKSKRNTGIKRKRPIPLKEKIGQTRLMNCGLWATVIWAKSSNHMTVQFEDGECRYGVSWSAFEQGAVAHPTKKPHQQNPLHEFSMRYYLKQLGFVKLEKGEFANCGFGQMELDFYNPYYNVAIESDGLAHNYKGSKERELKKDKACAEVGITLYRFRSPELPNLNSSSICFEMKEEDRLKSSVFDCTESLLYILDKHKIPHDHVEIDFKKDLYKILRAYSKTCVDNYDAFGNYVYRGTKLHVGQKVFHEATNQYMRIKKIYGYDDITIIWDDGAKKEHVNGSSFLHGTVKHPSKKRIYQKAISFEQAKIERPGMTVYSNSAKMTVKILEYINSKNMTVMFANGVIKYGVSYSCFKRGLVSLPREKKC